MKRYKTYKDSGVEWIGEIPINWEVKRLKLLGDIIPSNVDKKTKEGEQKVELCNYVDVYKNDFITDGIQFMKASASDVQIEKLTLRKFDVIATKDSEDPKDIGVPALVKNDFDNVVCGYHLTLVRCSENVLNGNYFYWVIRSEGSSQYFYTGARGITRYAIGSNVFKNLNIPIPKSLEEQNQIANYLNHKTTLLDTLIAKKEQLISLLEEERMATINKAVTKGLDPNVPLKDSGIDWLGEIPEHWESWKISHAFKNIGSGTTPESGNPIYHQNGTINWLNTGDLNDGVLNSSSKKITNKAIEDYSSLKTFPKGSLVIAMYGATIGKTALLNFETTTNQACCVFGVSDIISVKFLQYWFKAKKEHIINLSIGGGQPNISQQILKDIRLGCPNVEEQNEIIDFLDSKNKEIENLITKINNEINLLKEYKTALISEVVTGKIDVSNYK